MKERQCSVCNEIIWWDDSGSPPVCGNCAPGALDEERAHADRLAEALSNILEDYAESHQALTEHRKRREGWL